MKENVNFIKHMTETFRRFEEDSRGTGNHRALYMALFDCWNRSYFRTTISICRDEVMRIAGIRSTTLYYKCMKDLHAWEYISYEPSNSIYTGSKISMRRFDVADQPGTQLNGQLDTQLDDQLQVQSINSSNLASLPRPLPQDTTEAPAAPEEDTNVVAHGADLLRELFGDQPENQLDTQLNDQLQIQSINKSNLPAPVAGGYTEHTVPAPDRTLDWLTHDDAKPPERDPDLVGEQTCIPDREVQPPSLGEVVEYFRKRHFDVRDATMFFKYYQALGWVGKRKVPIADWQLYAEGWLGHIARSLLSRAWHLGATWRYKMSA